MSANIQRRQALWITLLVLLGFIRVNQLGRGRGGSSSGSSAPVFMGSGAASPDINSPSATASTDAPPAAGDILVAHITIIGTPGAVIPPAGEGWAVGDTANSSGGNAACYVLWKRWGSGATDNTTITFTGTAGNMRLVISRIRGCRATGDPFSSTAGSGGTVLTETAIAPSAAGGSRRLVMRFFSAARSSVPNANVASPTAAYGGPSFSWSVGLDGACCAGYAVSNSDPVGTSLATIL